MVTFVLQKCIPSAFHSTRMVRKEFVEIHIIIEGFFEKLMHSKITFYIFGENAMPEMLMLLIKHRGPEQEEGLMNYTNFNLGPQKSFFELLKLFLA